MYYKLIREKPQGKSVRGHLYSVEHRFSRSVSVYQEYLTPICETLENADYLIPALVYRVGVTQSPKFKRLLPVLQQVPGRTGIRVHRGSKAAHSKGCILVSAENEKRLTSLFLAEQSAREETRVEITN